MTDDQPLNEMYSVNTGEEIVSEGYIPPPINPIAKPQIPETKTNISGDSLPPNTSIPEVKPK